MDFFDTPRDASFRDELRRWLHRTVAELGPEPPNQTDRLTWWHRWQIAVFESGYAGLGWPAQYGGRGAGVLQQAIYFEECDLAGAPPRLNIIGEGIAGPTIIEFGSDEQKSRFLEPILRGADLWCQLFSEPGAGSDLASLSAKAIRDGDGWRVTGRKVWTSNAHNADYAILLARTGGAPRHHGITYFLLPMRQPEIHVHPLAHMLGEAEFNEVELDGVFVPDNLRVGEIDGGWKIAMTTLGYERAAIVTGRVNTWRVMDQIVALVRRGVDTSGRPLGTDEFIRQQVGDLYARTVLQRLTAKRILTGLSEGKAPGPEASTAKLFSAPLTEELADFALSLHGLRGQEQPLASTAAAAAWLRLSYQTRGSSIAGGTTFIQRNIAAERALGLPRQG
jgi:alkylation response protein AidB-like acyl-CoA dehydrogenase